VSLEELSISGGGPGDDITEEVIDKWLTITEGDETTACGCGDTPCLQVYKPAGSLVQHEGLDSSGKSSSLAQQKDSKTAKSKSVITLYWVARPVIDYRNCFLSLWTAMPVSPSAEFKIVGTKYDISKDLLKRADLTTSSPSSYNNKPINLCITKPMGTAADEFRKAFAGAFAGVGGFSTLISAATSIFGAGEVATVVHAIASNPSAFNLDATVNVLAEKSKSRKFTEFWSKITGSKTIAWLTLGSCGMAPITVPFQVVKHGGRYSASWDTGEAVTASEFAALIVMSR